MPTSRAPSRPTPVRPLADGAAGAPAGAPAGSAAEREPLRVGVSASVPAVQAGLAALLAAPGTTVVPIAAPAAVDPRSAAARPGGRDVGWSSDGPSPLDRLAAAPVDVVVWAPSPHEVDALGDPPPAARGRPAVVVVADAPSPDRRLALLRAGAAALVASAADGAELRAAVEAAAAGFVVVPGEWVGALLDRAASAPGAGGEGPRARATPADLPDPLAGRAGVAGGSLSEREREVLALLAEGLANKQIAPRLGISEHTVKAHVAAIFAKLGAGTRAEAVVTAARRGLLML